MILKIFKVVDYIEKRRCSQCKRMVFRLSETYRVNTKLSTIWLCDNCISKEKKASDDDLRRECNFHTYKYLTSIETKRISEVELRRKHNAESPDSP